MPFFIINTKNFPEAAGKRLDEICSFVSRSTRLEKTVRIFIAVPAFDLHYMSARHPKVTLLAQHLDDAKLGASTGALIPEIAKSSGASGSIINHSEHRIDKSTIFGIVKRLRDLGMISVVCAKGIDEVSQLSACDPDFIAIEPPELIGTGNAVSKASPGIITKSRTALDKSKARSSKTKLLCGAGIVDGPDAMKAIELGAEGILVASGVVLSKRWREKITELSTALSDARMR
jgi:triosephosphate isomerase (TIM)